MMILCVTVSLAVLAMAAAGFFRVLRSAERRHAERTREYYRIIARK